MTKTIVGARFTEGFTIPNEHKVERLDHGAYEVLPNVKILFCGTFFLETIDGKTFALKIDNDGNLHITPITDNAVVVLTEST